MPCRLARREDDLVGVRTDQAGDRISRTFDRLVGLPTKRMIGGMGVAEALRPKRRHRFDHPGVEAMLSR